MQFFNTNLIYSNLYCSEVERSKRYILAYAIILFMHALYVFFCSCAFMKDSVGATVIASINITFQDESELELSVGTVGPVAVAFEVFSDFKNYAGGVYDNPSCDTTPDKVR